MSCNLEEKKMFYTKDSLNYAKDQCVSETMELMGGNVHRCANTMMSMLHDSIDTDGCTYSHFAQKCRDHSKNFSLSDAEEFCHLKIAAQKKFWEKKRSTETSPHTLKRFETPVSTSDTKGADVPIFKNSAGGEK